MVLQETEQQIKRQNTHEARVLVIDADKATRSFLDTALRAYGYCVDKAATGKEGIFQFVSSQPDLILMDLNFGDMKGMAFMQMVRQWSEIPILIVSEPNRDIDIVEILDAGADDYIVKPFNIQELMARMRVALRHAQATSPLSAFALGDLKVDLQSRLVEVQGECVSLTPTEYDLLRILIVNAGKVVTQQEIWQQIRGDADQLDSHLIQVHMSNLRRKLEADPTDPQYISTIPGIGYRLSDKD